jgi:transposase
LRSTGRSGPIFQQDNDPKHRCKVAEEFLKRKKINRLSWPPSSPDLNIIEHVWDQLDRLLRVRTQLPRNQDEMWEALQEEWKNISQDFLDTLYESMTRRVQAVIKAKGGNTKY